MISVGLLCKFIEITLRHGCCPVNLQHISRTPFPKNISGGLLLKRCWFNDGTPEEEPLLRDGNEIFGKTILFHEVWKKCLILKEKKSIIKTFLNVLVKQRHLYSLIFFHRLEIHSYYWMLSHVHITDCWNSVMNFIQHLGVLYNNFIWEDLKYSMTLYDFKPKFGIVLGAAIAHWTLNNQFSHCIETSNLISLTNQLVVSI